MVNHDINDLKPSDEGINFWEEKFSIIEGAELSKYESVNSEDDLNDSYRIYRSRIFQNNSKALIYLLRMLPLGFFRGIRFKLADLQKYVDVDITSGDLIFSDVSNNFDIELESASLDFLFKNTFGFDTLTVNGCFEEGKNGGFSKFTKSLAIENLNNLGIAVNLKLILRFDLIMLFLKLVV